ncbi:MULTISPECIES: ATP-binding protein [unclassified Pseudodesulfovibrio]|uniref:chemotaxis protein CheA n=1 Tax=unclassified Pseudodesulfovibrio TaxID=2661612 RepID=UPI000FEB7C62|nr:MULTISPECIES: ATP-binding protein [unclassified Pseudodesulfovibrio]MCJ2163006.1 ATP-binding protein [Pseudodesulfovibrio sp. S3-i]RWU07002.1 chemotaxis protein CheA [Pseudodesulfovibrio sp. S3]
MQDSIIQCIEDIEKQILEVDATGQGAETVVDALGLSCMQLSSAGVIALLDMFKDGITPVNNDIISAMLGICEAQKKFFFALGGLLGGSAEALARIGTNRPKAAAVVEESEEEAAKAFEEPSTAEDDTPTETKAALEEEKSAEPEKAAAKPSAQAISSIRVGTDRLDRVIELVGKLMVTYAVIAQGGATNMSQVASSLRELDNVISKLQKEVNAIRLVPLKQIFTPMHRLVKSLSQKIGKKLEFDVRGDDLALDKTIVESLNEPLVHLLRNAVDHGLEDPEGRKAAGKSEAGVVTLSAWRKGDSAFIQVKDDGRGLDPDRILSKALEKGLADADKEYNKQEILQFVLQSGFSTAETITDVSGRGVGMDAVVNAIKVTLDGDVEIESTLGHGAAFTITIPLDRSANEGIVDALVCKVGGDTFIMPSRDVVEIYMPRLQDVVQLPDGRETVDVRGEIHSLLRLADLLELTPEINNIEMAQAIVVRVGDYKGAILVDEVLRQQQVVITGFTVPVEEIFHIPILGYGMMGESDALVINAEEMIQQFQERIARNAESSLT